MSEKLIEALGKLDSENDNHWTEQGLPQVETVKFLAADQSISRAMITAAAPNFTRTNMVIGEQPTREDLKEVVPGTNPPEEPPQIDLNVDLDYNWFTPENVNKLPKEDLQELDVVVKEHLSVAEKALAEAKNEVLRLQACETLVVNQMDRLIPPNHNQVNIASFFAQQDKDKKERQEFAEALAEKGLDVPKGSKLDQAFRAAKKGAGSKPPTFKTK